MNVIELTRIFFGLTGSILFVVGAMGTQLKPKNKFVAPVYIACAWCYVLGASFDLLQCIVMKKKNRETVVV
jgi:hypothetical protein